MKCKAAIAREGVVEFGWSEIELAEPRADEILVRIAGVGLCHTDRIARDQFIPVGSPAVLGHEGAVEVVKVGSEVTKVVPGNRVVLSFRSCGTCRNCGEHIRHQPRDRGSARRALHQGGPDSRRRQGSLS
jgi:aryl-alcohol dehydrogenase